MTFEEAKKILEKEGFKLDGPGKPHAVSGHFTEFEPLYIYEAMQVVTSAGYNIMMPVEAFDARKARLKKEHEEHANAPASDKEKEKKGNPALAESASQFNDALLDEQGKKIKRLGKEISRLNGIIHDKNEEIKRKTKGCCELVAENVDLKEDLRNTESLLHDTREANSRNLDTCFKNEDLIDELKKKLAEKTKLAKKYAKELSDSSLGLCKLEKQLKDKDAVLSDVAEDLRLTKIREKNLAELGLKYVGENEKLKKKLADKIVNEIDARALKSAESALAYKDEVIETLDKELAEVKHELSSLKRPFRPDSTEAVVLFTDAYAKAVRKHLPCTEWKNDGKEVSVTYILENGKKSKITLDFTGDEIIFSRTDPDKPRKDSLYSYKDKQLAEKDEVIADLGKELAATKKELEGTNNLVRMVRNASKEYCEYGIAAEKMIQKLSKIIVSKGLVPSDVFEKCRLWANGYRFNPQLPELSKEEEKKLSSGRDTHPTEDNPVKIGVDKAEEGADQSGKIVICGKDFGKLLKENEESAEELSKVLNDVIDQFLLFGEIIIKSEK